MADRQHLRALIDRYDARAPLANAWTIPADWYVDADVLELERRTVFSRSWQVAGRVEQLANPGAFVSVELPGGEPAVLVRGADDVLRAFFNVCRHHAAAVVTEPAGVARVLRCPYHGWTYSLAGELKGTPDFSGVCGFENAQHGLVPMETDIWERWAFARAERGDDSLASFLGDELRNQFAALGLERMRWVERRIYGLSCNWKVFVDNYLDGGYHVPHLHKGLDSVLDYSSYAIENGGHHCLQWSPIVSEGAEEATGAVRTGDAARYYWIYPNFMINCYAAAMDTNLVIPRGVDRTDVIFDFYFDDVSADAEGRNKASIEVSERIQEEDVAICESVQRGLKSRAYEAGRLSVRREAGEHLFHRLLHQDLLSGLSE